jgi:hypothetical protein
MDKPRVLSFGGGVQSSALVALLGTGRYPGEPPQEVWFCDPKNERPQTYSWIETTIKPYCARLGVPFVTLERWCTKTKQADLLVSYRARKMYPLRRDRSCTIHWKVDVMLRECKRRGWDQAGGVEKHIGISLDELHRARTGREHDWETKRYPLIEARLFRDDCASICQDVFGTVPVKSGCWFCKFARPAQWREVWEQRADGRWDIAVAWEKEVLAAKQQRHVFIDTQPQRTLEQWAHAWQQGDQLALPSADDAACDGGYCMT